MTIYISTNMYEPENLNRVFELLVRSNDPLLGIEIFPEWHSPVFCDNLSAFLETFRSYPISLHGPYYHTEHTKPEGCAEYVQALEYFRQTLVLSKNLNSSYIVYHHNNCRIEAANREAMVRISARNLELLRDEAKQFQARIVVENAGVRARGNMLFDETEFIRMAQDIPDAILLDIGHAHANGWDLCRVMQTLAHKIVAYHVHNNDGYEDCHNRIFDGTLNIDHFLAWYKEYTPQADLVIEYGKQCAQDTDGIVKDIAYIRQQVWQG